MTSLLLRRAREPRSSLLYLYLQPTNGELMMSSAPSHWRTLEDNGIECGRVVRRWHDGRYLWGASTWFQETGLALTEGKAD